MEGDVLKEVTVFMKTENSSQGTSSKNRLFAFSQEKPVINMNMSAQSPCYNMSFHHRTCQPPPHSGVASIRRSVASEGSGYWCRTWLPSYYYKCLIICVIIEDDET